MTSGVTSGQGYFLMGSELVPPYCLSQVFSLPPFAEEMVITGPLKISFCAFLYCGKQFEMLV